MVIVPAKMPESRERAAEQQREDRESRVPQTGNRPIV
jgi:hypothetical protein